MKKTLIYLTALIVMSACIFEMALPSRRIFEQGNLNALAYNYNNHDKTTSILYGNEQALAVLTDETHSGRAGAIFKLVRTAAESSGFGLDFFKSDPELLNVETVSITAGIDGSLKTTYKIENFDRTGRHKENNSQERIRFITTLRSSAEP